VVSGSDHLTAYNVFAEAVNRYGHLGRVHDLPRHLFGEEMDEWAESRGILIKAIEDIALGTAAVYRTLEAPLPEKLPYAGSQALRSFRELVTRIAPFDVAIEQELADGRPVRISRGSMCGAWGAIAGSVRYFSSPEGQARAAIEGTNIPFEMIKQYAKQGRPEVEYRDDRRHAGLVTVRRTEYAGFELERQRSLLADPFPVELADAAREALVTALVEDRTTHPDQRAVSRPRARLDEYWRRSGGTAVDAAPERVRRLLGDQLAGATGWSAFLETRLALSVDTLVPESVRRASDSLPTSITVLGDRVPMTYEVEAGVPIARVHLREGQARRLRERDLPPMDRPLHFGLTRNHGVEIKAATLDELKGILTSLQRSKRHARHPRKRSRR
jgi:hypothetical protein